MMDEIINILADELGRDKRHIENVIKLLDEGNTVPFIARYRKELHGAMDDETLRNLETRLEYLRGLRDRREVILRAIEEQGKLTDELSRDISQAKTLAELEDLYRPYKPKRRTRAVIAKEKGLDPLADVLFSQKPDGPTPDEAAAAFMAANPDKVGDMQEALAGASDIIAEKISDDAALRKKLRTLSERIGEAQSQAANPEEDSVYKIYYDFHQPVSRLKGYQILAMNRGEKEKYLKINFMTDHDKAMEIVYKTSAIPGSPSTDFVKSAALDAYDRLIAPSMERELRSALTEWACTGAIEQFSKNLRPLLLCPPVKGKITMGLDPGYRNGCKVAVVDGTGKVLDTTVVYPALGERQKQDAIVKLSELTRKYHVEHLAIGNGTASRETEQMAAELIRQENARPENEKKLSYMIVSEAGASVYSASKLAAEEFPDFDVNLRSAVSIARRLQDPLAELVKIDPKSIGVGQYQHDMPPKQLEAALDAVVEDCVNAVGVDVNTASPSLLRRVAGLTGATAKNIVLYREENGAFMSRKQLLKVPKLGPKAYQQCAGFLRVPESENILDNTAVHPESYPAAEALLNLMNYHLMDVKSGKLGDLRRQVESYGVERAAAEIKTGVPTLLDVIGELIKPGRDMRDSLPKPILRTDVFSISDLKPGMKLTGTVRNVMDFGAFIDIGVHHDGLAHISRIADRYIRHPSEVLSVGDVVDVTVIDVDEKRNRIALSLRD